MVPLRMRMVRGKVVVPRRVVVPRVTWRAMLRRCRVFRVRVLPRWTGRVWIPAFASPVMSR